MMDFEELESVCKTTLEEEIVRLENFLKNEHKIKKKSARELSREDRFNEDNLNHRDEKMAKEKIQDCKDALKRIENKTFGVCVDFGFNFTCKGRIPNARLMAWPYAKRCVPCQEKRDKQKIC